MHPYRKGFGKMAEIQKKEQALITKLIHQTGWERLPEGSFRLVED